MPLALEYLHPADRDRLVPPPSLVQQHLDVFAGQIRGTETAEEAFTLLVQAMPKEIPFDRVGVGILGDEGLVVTLNHLYSDHPVLWGEGESRRLLGSSLEPLFNEGAIRIIYDLPEYLHLRPSSLPTKQLVLEGMRSSLAVPLYHRERAIGVLFITSCHAKTYDLTHVADLMQLAPVIGEAFGRAQVTRQVTAAAG